jgi:CheY-like chemotaxis protein
LASSPGQGSEFSLELTLPVAQKPSRRQADSGISHAHFPGARVLVAEDNQVNQKLVSYMLEDLGIQVLLADNGKVAYDLLEREAVDLVLMDCQMPEWDGLTASREIRTRERRQNQQRVPILALTANSMPGFEATCIEAGMDATLAKPLREEDLNFALQHWLPARACPGEAPRTTEAGALDLEAAETVDLAKIRRLCRDDADKVAEMLALYISSSETLLTQLAQAIDEADFPHAARHAHQIKGASAYIGADAVTRLSAALETAAKTEDLTCCRDTLEDLEAAFIRCRLEIEEHGLRDAALPSATR